MGALAGGAQGESDPLKQMNLIPDYGSHSNYTVKFRKGSAEISFKRQHVIFMHIKRLFICPSHAQMLPGTDGDYGATSGASVVRMAVSRTRVRVTQKWLQRLRESKYNTTHNLKQLVLPFSICAVQRAKVMTTVMTADCSWAEQCGAVARRAKRSSSFYGLRCLVRS